MKFILIEIISGKEFIWTAKELLEEINRDRSEEWENYNIEDILEGWREWCQGEFYSLIGIKEV